jgi:ATP-dependent DNA helicase DinG
LIKYDGAMCGMVMALCRSSSSGNGRDTDDGWLYGCLTGPDCATRRFRWPCGPDADVEAGSPPEGIASDAIWLSHDATVERAVLKQAGVTVPAARVVDTRLLSQILYPMLADHSLTGLAGELGLCLSVDDPADSDAGGPGPDGVLALWADLRQRAASLPPVVLVEINQLLCFERHLPYRRFFLDAEKRCRETAAGPRGRLTDLLSVNDFPRRRKPSEEDAEWQPIDPEEAAELLGPAGPFAAAVSAYEHREGQLAMARCVAEAFNGSRHLMVEAGTGIGKSLAYLVPSVLWARANQTPVVISTNTKNLQSQLIDKDLPLFREVTGIDFRAALVKGRMNYLCLRKLFYVLRHADTELGRDDEKLLLCGVLVWLAETEGGDFAENACWGRPGAAALGTKLTSTGEECAGRACGHYRRCFLWRARSRAQAADIVVANHALVFAEMNMKSPALPPYAHVVFDEAHNIEDVATRHFAVEVSAGRTRFPLRRLWRAGRRKRQRGAGLIPSLRKQVESGAFSGDPEVQARAVKLCNKVVEGVRSAGDAIPPFLEALAGLAPNGRRESVRIRPECRETAAWETIESCRKAVVAALGEVKQRVVRLAEVFKTMEEGGLPFQTETVRDLDAMVAWLGEVASDIDFVLACEDEAYVYWVEPTSPRAGGVRAWAAPISVGPRLRENLYAQKDAIVFSSATLTVGGSCKFLKARLGLDALDEERLVERNVGSPFDYPEQCAVLVPMFLPEPGGDRADYAEKVGELLSDLFRRTRGRAMALFTSYDMLRRTTERLQEGLRGSNIQVLAQGASGSRENITRLFKQDLESVLMGTHSFWEGVDLVGETLSCLVVARLPFAVYTDPIHEARCEQVETEGKSAFFGYSLPNAVIRFRQGFGRLIRHRTDRGVVVVTDRRIVSKRYGSWFRRSLPVHSAPVERPEQFFDAIDGFLGGG